MCLGPESIFRKTSSTNWWVKTATDLWWLASFPATERRTQGHVHFMRKWSSGGFVWCPRLVSAGCHHPDTLRPAHQQRAPGISCGRRAAISQSPYFLLLCRREGPVSPCGRNWWTSNKDEGKVNRAAVWSRPSRWWNFSERSADGSPVMVHWHQTQSLINHTQIFIFSHCCNLMCHQPLFGWIKSPKYQIWSHN